MGIESISPRRLRHILLDVLIGITAVVVLVWTTPSELRADSWWTLAIGVSWACGLVATQLALHPRRTGETADQTRIPRYALPALLGFALGLLCANLLTPSRAWGTAHVLFAIVASGISVGQRMSTGVATTSNPRFAGLPRILVYGVGPTALEFRRSALENPELGQILGFIRSPNDVEVCVPAEEIILHNRPLKQISIDIAADEVVIALSERRGGSMSLRELLDCRIAGISVRELNSYFEERLGRIRLEYLKAGWLIFSDGFKQGILRSTLKRAFDVLSAVTLMTLSLPAMIITAIAIRVESRGPVLYRQERTGLSGHSFEVIKFRSMTVDAECDGRPRWAIAGDSRVTRVGRIIRKTRIDELPQLWCVVRGTMSMVGPRPERPFFVDQLTKEIPFYAVRHCVKPGVTGWAQVRAEYGSSVEETRTKLQYDLYYVKNHSLLLDLRIMLQTVVVVLTGRGAR